MGGRGNDDNLHVTTTNIIYIRAVEKLGESKKRKRAEVEELAKRAMALQKEVSGERNALPVVILTPPHMDTYIHITYIRLSLSRVFLNRPSPCAMHHTAQHNTGAEEGGDAVRQEPGEPATRGRVSIEYK